MISLLLPENLCIEKTPPTPAFPRPWNQISMHDKKRLSIQGNEYKEKLQKALD
jgi:hypothetical protein